MDLEICTLEVADVGPVVLDLGLEVASKQLKMGSCSEVALPQRDEVGDVQNCVGVR